MSSGQIFVKKKKIRSFIPLKKTNIDLTKKTPGSRKKKTLEATSLSLENIVAKDAPQRLVSFSQDLGVSLTFVIYTLPFTLFDVTLVLGL